MSLNDEAQTRPKTQWTNALLEDLCVALRGERDDATVRGFARELCDEKGLPLPYLVRKVRERVGDTAAERLDVLIRGRYVVEREKAAQAREGGVRRLMRRLFG